MIDTEALILWPPDAKSQLIGKDPDAGKVQFCSVTQLCLTLVYPMDCGMRGFPVHHQIPELAQTHVHLVGDAIQPSHPLSSPAPPTFNLPSISCLFQ